MGLFVLEEGSMIHPKEVPQLLILPTLSYRICEWFFLTVALQRARDFGALLFLLETEEILTITFF